MGNFPIVVDHSLSLSTAPSPWAATAASAGHASFSHALLGSRVYIYPGARIGQEGLRWPRRVIHALAKAARSVRRPALSLTPPAGSVLLGGPAQPHKEFFRQVTTLKRMAQAARVAKLCPATRDSQAKLPLHRPRNTSYHVSTSHLR